MLTTVYFATNRALEGPATDWTSYGTNIVAPTDPTAITYATAFVDNTNLTADTTGAIQMIENVSTGRFSQSAMDDLSNPGRNLLIFVHGFDNSFENAITRAVGVYEHVEPDTLVLDLTAGDRFLLCSDGLCGYFEQDLDGLGKRLANPDADAAAKSLIDAANEQGGKDNITSVIVTVGDVTERDETRAKQLQLGLPDGLDLMVICAEAGLSLDATLVRVSRELGNTWPELAEEFGITAAELTFLPDRRMAFDNLNNRTDSDGVRGVVNTLQQTAKYGTPLAQSLRVLAAEMRTARMTRAEEKAARLPALLTIPMMIFILPTLFIVLLGPAAINVMDTFKH